MTNLTAGAGKTLEEVYESLFGPSKAAKAWRALMKSEGIGTESELAELNKQAEPAFHDLAGSQETKAQWNVNGPFRLMWDPGMDAVRFSQRNGAGYNLKAMKQWFDIKMGTPAKRLSKDTNQFLSKWVNTNISQMPRGNREITLELTPYRPETTRILYRGIRFTDIGEMVEFHQNYGTTGKSFPFESPRLSSWTTSREVAERFSRMGPADSHAGAMMGWLVSFKSQKNYDGMGGFIIGARVAPDQCLVDLNHEALPFGGGQHGNESETIVLPGVKLTAKVYEVFGDVEREVSDFLNSYSAKNPSDPFFFPYLGTLKIKEQSGDADSGSIVFELKKGYIKDQDWEGIKKLSPREVVENKKGLFDGDDPIKIFRTQLYEAKWSSPTTISYKRMTSAVKRVASRYAAQQARC